MPRIPGLIELFFVSPLRTDRRRNGIVNRRIAELVRHAATHVPLYRAHYAQHNVDVARVRSAADLHAIPLIEKEQIIDAGSGALSDLAPQDRLDRMRTSGTSGRALEIARIRPEMAATRRGVLRQLVRLGLRPWHRVLTLGSQWLRHRRGIFVRELVSTRFIEPLTPVDEQIRTLYAFQPDALVGQTGGLYLLARELLRRGQQYHADWVVPTGATLAPHMRVTLRQAFGCDPRDMYGAIELGPIAWQCRAGAYHLDADRVLVEIVDDAGQAVPDGSAGQVVCTGLHNFTMPLIRYKLRDVSMKLTSRCDCGVNFPLLAQVQGRVNDFLPTPEGDLVSPHFFFHIFDRCARNPVQDWRVVQEGLGRLIYEYVPERWWSSDLFDPGMRAIKQRFGAACTVVPRRVPEIALTPAGKQRCIESRLRPEKLDWRTPWAETIEIANRARRHAGGSRSDTNAEAAESLVSH